MTPETAEPPVGHQPIAETNLMLIARITSDKNVMAARLQVADTGSDSLSQELVGYE